MKEASFLPLFPPPKVFAGFLSEHLRTVWVGLKDQPVPTPFHEKSRLRSFYVAANPTQTPHLLENPFLSLISAHSSTHPVALHPVQSITSIVQGIPSAPRSAHRKNPNPTQQHPTRQAGSNPCPSSSKNPKSPRKQQDLFGEADKKISLKNRNSVMIKRCYF